MSSSVVLPLLAPIADPARRSGAAAELARWLGVDAVVLLFVDPARGERVLAPGFAEAPPGNAARRVSADGTELVLVGGRPDAARVDEVMLGLPLVGALLRAEREASAARSQLKETDRRKDEFLAMLGHELRNPMAAIAGALEVMRLEPRDPDRAERARAVIERQTNQLARLVDDLLDVERISRGKIVLRLAPVAARAVIERAIEGTRSLLDARRHTLDVRLTDDVFVEADPARLEQMITNLLTNAASYTEPGGHVRVTVERDTARGEAVISVCDDGIGIDPAMLGRVFEPFVQLGRSAEGGGLGIGLTLLERLAELHGARVEVSSRPGCGSTFSLRLRSVAAPAGSSPPMQSEPPRAGKRILVVDDNVDSGEMLAEVVRSWGHDADHVADGPRALARAAELTPDTVLLDLGLPGMDGFEVAARLRVAPPTRDCRIIAISGYGQDDDRKRSRAAGCDEHLVKPVDLRALARAISKRP